MRVGTLTPRINHPMNLLPMTSLLVFAVTFAAMEGVTYATHRWVMHGVGWVLHRSHHQALARRFQANDWFPVAFSGVAMALFALALQVRPLLPVYWGVVAYGVAYLTVHDLYIHGRLPLPRNLLRFLEPLREAHRIHHLYGGEPFGMLAPIIRPELRRKAATTTRDPLARGLTSERRT